MEAVTENLICESNGLTRKRAGGREDGESSVKAGINQNSPIKTRRAKKPRD